MAENSALMRKLALCLVTIPALWLSAQSTRRQNMPQADVEIAKFRSGERYLPPPSAAFLAQGQIREKELARFEPALTEESAKVREQIVQLLADVGMRGDPLFELGGQVIRQPHIIAMLAGAGLSKPDLGREAALTALQEHAPAALLKPHATKLVADLEAHPGPTALLLIAKVKPPEATAFVRQLPASPERAIAAAALGDMSVERQSDDAFTAASVPEEKARLAHVLGLIGTATSLKALAAGLRTELVIDRVMVSKRSVRLDVLEALSYNFPDEPVLYESQIHDDSGYERAEKFCEEHFGVKWDRPRPPYMKIKGYPIPMPPQV